MQHPRPARPRRRLRRPLQPRQGDPPEGPRRGSPPDGRAPAPGRSSWRRGSPGTAASRPFVELRVTSPGPSHGRQRRHRGERQRLRASPWRRPRRWPACWSWRAGAARELVVGSGAGALFQSGDAGIWRTSSSGCCAARSGRHRRARRRLRARPGELVAGHVPPSTRSIAGRSPPRPPDPAPRRAWAAGSTTRAAGGRFSVPRGHRPQAPQRAVARDQQRPVADDGAPGAGAGRRPAHRAQRRARVSVLGELAEHVNRRRPRR